MSARTEKVSVIMSVFNGEKYIHRAVSSILSQSYSDLELIVIDDGSKDRTSEVISSFRDKRLRFFHQENMGLTKSLNKGLAISQGRWIARHDADDFSIYNRLERQIDYLNSNPEVKLLGSSCFIQPSKHNVVNEIYSYPCRHSQLVEAMPYYNPFVHGSIVVDRDTLEKHNGYNENYKYVQDYELWSRLLPEIKAANYPAPLYVRSVHLNSSEISVDKSNVSNTIQKDFIRRNPSLKNDGSQRIKTINIYPLCPYKEGWNKSLSRSFKMMSKYCHGNIKKFIGYKFQAALYWPFG